MQPAAEERPPLWTRSFLTVILINLIFFLSFRMVMPVIPVYIRGPLGGSDVAVGFLAGLFTLSAVVARPLVGLLLDRVGRRQVLAAGMLLFAFGVFGYGLAGGIVVLAVFRVVHGLGFAGTSTATNTMAADAVPVARRNEGLGYFGMSGTAMDAVGPTLGFWLAGAFSYRVMFNTSVFFALAALAVIMWTGRPGSKASDVEYTPVPQEHSSFTATVKTLIEPQSLPAALMMLTITLTYGAASAFIALYAPQVGLENPGLYFLVFAVAILVSRPVSSTLADRLGAGPVLVPSVGLVAVGFLLMWRAFNPFSLLAGAAVYGLGFSGLVPIFLSLAITHAPDERRGAATATYYTAFDLGIAVGATAMGPVAEAFGYRAVFGSCMGIALVALLILIRMLPLLRPNTGGVPGPNPS